MAGTVNRHIVQQKKVLIRVTAPDMQATQSIGAGLNTGLQRGLPKQVCLAARHGQSTHLLQIHIGWATTFLFFGFRFCQAGITTSGKVFIEISRSRIIFSCGALTTMRCI